MTVGEVWHDSRMLMLIQLGIDLCVMFTHGMITMLAYSLCCVKIFANAQLFVATLYRHVVINCADRVARKNVKKKESLLNCLELKLARLLCDFHQKPVGMEMEFDI